MVRFLALSPFSAFFAGCAWGAWQGDYDRLSADVVDVETFVARVPERYSGDDPGLDQELAGSVDAEKLVAVALVRNPELRESLARVRSGLETVRRAGALDDPVLKYEAWAVPLRTPVAFDRADTNMIGLMQNVPFPGNLSLRAESALREAESTFQEYRERRLELAARVKKAYYEYFALDKDLEIHLEHVRILEDFERIAATKFRTGAVSQEDVLKPQVELVKLHNDVLAIEQRLGSIRARLNALLDRPPRAPLGKPLELSPSDQRFDRQELMAKALDSRPEILAARLKTKATELGLDLARREATWPDFGLGVDYWQMPERDDAWGGVVSINLPWLTGKKTAEARRMEHALRGDRAAVDAARNRVAFDVEDAYLRVEAARRSVVLFKGELLPKSTQSVDVSRAAYEKDRTSFLELLDAERSQRDVKLGYYQALAAYASAVADLARAVGRELEE